MGAWHQCVHCHAHLYGHQVVVGALSCVQLEECCMEGRGIVGKKGREWGIVEKKGREWGIIYIYLLVWFLVLEWVVWKLIGGWDDSGNAEQATTCTLTKYTNSIS